MGAPVRKSSERARTRGLKRRARSDTGQRRTRHAANTLPAQNKSREKARSSAKEKQEGEKQGAERRQGGGGRGRGRGWRRGEREKEKLGGRGGEVVSIEATVASLKFFFFFGIIPIRHSTRNVIALCIARCSAPSLVFPVAPFVTTPRSTRLITLQPSLTSCALSFPAPPWSAMVFHQRRRMSSSVGS